MKLLMRILFLQFVTSLLGFYFTSHYEGLDVGFRQYGWLAIVSCFNLITGWIFDERR